MRENIFLHFLNRDSREIFGLFRAYRDEEHFRLLRRALNVSVLLCEDYCVLPPGFVVEDEIAFSLAETQTEYLTAGVLKFPMREGNIADYADKKRSEYYPMRDRYSGLFNDDRLTFLGRNAAGLIRRKTFISEGIVEGWRAGAEANKRAWAPVKRKLAPAAIDSIGSIPVTLSDNGIALTWSAIAPKLPDAAKGASGELRNALQYTYFKQYCDEFGLITLTSIPYMIEEFYLPRKPRSYSYTLFQRYLESFGISRLLLDAPSDLIHQLKLRPGMTAFLDAYIELAEASTTATDLTFAASRTVASSSFKWASFGKRFNSFIEVPGELEVAELDDGMADVAAALTRDHGLASRKPVQAAEHPRRNAIVRGSPPLPDLVLFVALEEELKVLAEELKLKRLVGGSPAASGEIQGVKVDVICPRNMGRVAAAVEVGHYLSLRRERPPKLVVAVGLAGGFADEGSRPGHTICVTNVVDLAHRKITENAEGLAHTKFRRRDFPIDSTLRDVLWSDLFDRTVWINAAIEAADWPEDRRPSLHYGALASVDEVVASDDWTRKIRDHTEKLLGVEMEAGGVCAAAEKFSVPVSMLRVVSDNSDPAKADDAWRKIGMRTLTQLLLHAPLAAVLDSVRR